MILHYNSTDSVEYTQSEFDTIILDDCIHVNNWKIGRKITHNIYNQFTLMVSDKTGIIHDVKCEQGLISDGFVLSNVSDIDEVISGFIAHCDIFKRENWRDYLDWEYFKVVSEICNKGEYSGFKDILCNVVYYNEQIAYLDYCEQIYSLLKHGLHLRKLDMEKIIPNDMYSLFLQGKKRMLGVVNRVIWNEFHVCLKIEDNGCELTDSPLL